MKRIVFPRLFLLTAFSGLGIFGCLKEPAEDARKSEPEKVGATTHALWANNHGTAEELLALTERAFAEPFSTSSGSPFVLNPSWSEGLEDTREGRGALDLFARCALGASEVLTANSGGTPYTFNGSLGVRGAWLETGCDQTCKERMLACYALHLNIFGLHLNISVRGPGLPFDPAEHVENPMAEATFFSDGDKIYGCLTPSPGGLFGDVRARRCGDSAHCPLTTFPEVLCTGYCAGLGTATGATICYDKRCSDAECKKAPKGAKVFKNPMTIFLTKKDLDTIQLLYKAILGMPITP